MCLPLIVWVIASAKMYLLSQGAEAFSIPVGKVMGGKKSNKHMQRKGVACADRKKHKRMPWKKRHYLICNSNLGTTLHVPSYSVLTDFISFV